MSTVDIIIAVIIVGAAIWGAFKGFVKQAISIAGVLLGIWCGFKFSAWLATQTKDLLSLSMAQDTLGIIAFAVIFLVVLILTHFIGKGIEKIIKLSMLGWLNRLLGFLFGGVKATILLGLAVYVLNYLNKMFHFIPKEILDGSKGYAFLEQFNSNIFPFLERIFS